MTSLQHETNYLKACVENEALENKESQTIVKDRWISLYADECELPNGRVISPFYVIEEKDSVHIVAINSKREVLLTRQYRHGAVIVCSELPCGFIESGEDPLDAAQRELKEETGCIADKWTKGVVLFANPARQNSRIHCFVAEGVRQAENQTGDDSEEISFAFVSMKEVLRRIESGEFGQALHVASYLCALRTIQKL